MNESRFFAELVRPAYRGARGLLNRGLERRAGIRTEGFVSAEELGFEAHRERYQPAGWFQLRRILPVRQVGPQDVFIDVGSGMGRVVYQAAAWYPFRRVIGLELSERLNVIARDNLRRAEPRLRCPEVEIVTADVLEYELPDDVNVVYLNNPFNGPVFEAAIDRLLASMRRRPRAVRVIYANPKDESVLLRAGFRPVRTLRGLRPGAEWSRSNSVRLYAGGSEG